MWVTSPSRTFLGLFRAPAARAKREAGSVTVLVQVGLSFAQRKTQTLNTASLCAALTGSQVLVILLDRSSVLHKPSRSRPVLFPLCKRLRCSDFLQATHLSGFIAQVHNHGTEVLPVSEMGGRRCRQYARIENRL